MQQVKARELVVPRTIWKALHGTAVDFLLFRPQAILGEKYCQTLIKAGIVRVAVDFTPENCQRSGNLL